MVGLLIKTKLPRKSNCVRLLFSHSQKQNCIRKKKNMGWIMEREREKEKKWKWDNVNKTS